MKKSYIAPYYFRDKKKMNNLISTLVLLDSLCNEYFNFFEYDKASRKLKRLVDNLSKYLQNERSTRDC